MTKIYSACDERVCNCPDLIYKGNFVYIIDDYGNIAKFYDIVFDDLVKTISLDKLETNYLNIEDEKENTVCMLKEHWEIIVDKHNKHKNKE